MNARNSWLRAASLSADFDVIDNGNQNRQSVETRFSPRLTMMGRQAGVACAHEARPERRGRSVVETGTP
jgi:hypothetical protein